VCPSHLVSPWSASHANHHLRCYYYDHQSPCASFFILSRVFMCACNTLHARFQSRGSVVSQRRGKLKKYTECKRAIGLEVIAAARRLPLRNYGDSIFQLCLWSQPNNKPHCSFTWRCESPGNCQFAFFFSFESQCGIS
jgi:hypothetical protein